MKIRNIEESDLTSCAALYTKVFSLEPWNEPWTIELARVRLEHIYQSKGFFGVLAEDGGTLGFSMGNVEPYIKKSIFYLREMCVEGDKQNQGLGEKMLRAMEQSLVERNVGSVVLNTATESNADKFYRKQGFNAPEDFKFYTKAIR